MLRITDANVFYPAITGGTTAVREAALAVDAGECVALVGESGCGKSSLVSAAIGALPTSAQVSGQVELDGQVCDLADTATLTRLRGRGIACVPQGAMAGLHPCYRVGDQIAEVIALGDRLTGTAVEIQIRELLASVGLDASVADSYPHECSGGMRQRVALACALASSPQVLLADEPTVGLDAAVARQFLDVLRTRQTELGFGLLIVSHDLPAISAIADRLVVVYDGRVVESGPVAQIRSTPRHPYSQGLMLAAPQLGHLGWGAIPEADPLPDDAAGCRFRPRCPLATSACADDVPPLVDHGDGAVACYHPLSCDHERIFPVTEPSTGLMRPERVVEVRGASQTFRSRRWFRTRETHALINASMTVNIGEAVGIVGASGSGKSTLARALFGLNEPQIGEIIVDGVNVRNASRSELISLRRRLALVSQDPYSSLHRAMNVWDVVAEPLAITGVNKATRRERAVAVLDDVGLDADQADRRCGQLSGGQRQRVAIARALIAEPRLVVFDEPMSMLDASVRAGIAQLMLQVKDAANTGIILITHDLAEAVALCDTLLVMHEGRIVERGKPAAVIANPTHEATRRLIAQTGWSHEEPEPAPAAPSTDDPTTKPASESATENPQVCDGIQ